jgi:hypothetical protein
MPTPHADADVVGPIRMALKGMSAAILAQLGPAPDGISESYHDIPMRDGYVSSIKVQKPSSGPPGALAVLMYGGGQSTPSYNLA